MRRLAGPLLRGTCLQRDADKAEAPLQDDVHQTGLHKQALARAADCQGYRPPGAPAEADPSKINTSSFNAK